MTTSVESTSTPLVDGPKHAIQLTDEHHTAIEAAACRAAADLRAALDAFIPTIAPVLAGRREERAMSEALGEIQDAQRGLYKSLTPVWAAIRIAHPESIGIGEVRLDGPTFEALRRAGVHTSAQLEEGLAAGTLSDVPGIGPSRLRDITDGLAELREELLKSVVVVSA